MGNRPSTKAIFAIPITDADWKADEETISPKWQHLDHTTSYIEDGFEEVFYPFPGSVGPHSYYYCGAYDKPPTVFIGVLLWKIDWAGESQAIAPTDEQRTAVAAFLDSVGLGDRVPAVYVLTSYG